MTSGLGGDRPGQTPLEPEDVRGLVPSWIATRADLDRAESENILRGLRWATRPQRTVVQILDEAFLQHLHRRLFGDVWRWAGTYRIRDTNRGVPHWSIRVEMAPLLRDDAWWIAESDMDDDEAAVRFHHRLVVVHPFPNGNGRHSRIAADLLVEALGAPRFTWGGGVPLADPRDERRRYVAALQAADAGDVRELMAFARA